METFNDITREMRAYAKKSEIDGGLIDVWDWLPEFADRLEAAYKRDMQAIVETNEIAIRTAMDEIAKLRKTNEVLECARDLWFERADELRRRCEALNNGGAK